MKKIVGSALLIGGLTLLTASARAQQAAPLPSGGRDLLADTWVATDSLGRKTPTSAQTRPPQPAKFVGMFYFLWHGQHGKTGPYDNTKTVADPQKYPFGGPGAFHWWGEPAVGYFLADDPWVHRKNLEMLADAGVDVVFFDVTNAFTYHDIVLTVCNVAAQMRQQGNPCPQIAFIAHAATAKTVTSLYNDFYAKGLYQDLWFQWDGKPLMLGDKASKLDDGTRLAPKVVDFFTWRNSWAWDPGRDKWQWIDKYPQRAGWHTDSAVPEEAPVAIAGHPTDSLGRSFHSDEKWGQGTEPPVDAQYRTPDTNKGLQFSQQWRRALEIDPQFIFVTGWNEWVAQRFLANGPGTFAGRPQVKGGTFFVDNFTEEFSRDAMPMKGGYGDNYYMQLVDGIRQFKGVRPVAVAHGFQTIAVNGSFSQWRSIDPEYLDTVGDTSHRNHDGWGSLHYVNDTGRNDIVSAKIACDKNDIYFYVQTHSALTPSTDQNWMQLLIDADQNSQTGWNGYDYVVNSEVRDAHTTTLKRLSDGKIWAVKYRAAGNQMQIAVPRTLLGLSIVSKTHFDFHWLDNVPVGTGALADWWYNGDSAPDGRFNYRYENAR